MSRPYHPPPAVIIGASVLFLASLTGALVAVVADRLADRIYGWVVGR